MGLGPVMVDVTGFSLAPADRELLAHPAVCGVLLFGRNYESIEQLESLVAEIHAVREPRLLVAVDHEGGRVQRFRKGFTLLPAASRYGELHGRDPAAALAAAEHGGWLMAAELRSVGIDFSFAPVLDVAAGRNAVIGDRAFHRAPATAVELARRFARGMRAAGMAAVGKHFPGHGHVAADSHLTLPRDGRDLETLRLEDMLVFERLVHGGIPALMPAHVLYEAVDDRPAGFSPVWLKDILRGELGFQGAVFSDDLSMAGAASAGDHLARARAALDAGCDVVLVCNEPERAAEVIEGIRGRADPLRSVRLVRMHGRGATSREALFASVRYAEAAGLMTRLNSEPELDLGDDTPL